MSSIQTETTMHENKKGTEKYNPQGREKLINKNKPKINPEDRISI